MFSPKHLLLVALLLATSNFHFEALGDDPLGGLKPPQNGSKCDAPCEQLTPPPPTPSGYSIYSAPPPPHKSSQSKCPPAPGAPTIPYTPYYGPPYYGPPNPYYIYSPPGVYTPVPYGQGTRSASKILPILAPVMMLFSSVIFVF